VAKRIYTILVVPEHSSKVRRFKLPHQFLLRAGLGAVVLVALSGFALVHYLFIVDQAQETRGLKAENIQLKTRVRMVQEEIARIDAQVQRIDQFATRIRGITQVHDPDRHLAMGPLELDGEASADRVLYSPGERIDYEDELIDSKMALRLVDSRLDQVDQQVNAQESNIRELNEYFAEETALLTSIPSLRPTRSRLLTSRFGMRVDPYTNQEVMHKGLDFAAEHGSGVVAPANGTVVFAGNRGNYGKTLVVDHGFGLQTHYAHLSSYQVTAGQKVKRGQMIASVGNTGRTTGAHLHYEVRYRGIPQDPSRYILNQ